jgi:TRAP-type mannitol/chloroaromatic compound transport system permease large subunit
MAVFPILLVFLLKLITLALPTAGSQFKSVGMLIRGQCHTCCHWRSLKMSVAVTVIQTTCSFFLLLCSGLGSSFFLFTGVFVGSKSSTALLSDHLSILCRLT